MNIDQWAAQASTDLRAEGETQAEYEARIAALRKFSAENSEKHQWSRPRRKPPEKGTSPCPR